MDKERKAYEALIQAINTRSRSSSLAKQAHYQQQLQFLRKFESQATGEPYGSKTTAQLAQLLTEDEADSLNPNAWLLWLNELLLSRKQQLGDTQPLLEWLLQRVEQQPTAPDALRCLLSVLESLPSGEARAHFPRLAAIPMPDGVEAALLLIHCQDVLFGALGELDDSELQLSMELANALLKPLYEGHWTESKVKLHEAEQERLQSLLAHTLQLLQKITAQHADYAQQHAPELLGFALANIRCRTEAQLGLTVPHRVQPAQQSAGYCQEADDLGSSNNQSAAATGRRAKSRKMRSLTKQRNNGNVPPEGANASELATGQGSDRLQQLLQQGSNDNGLRTTSGDSEGACTPTSDGAAQQLSIQKQQRQCQVKVRLAALQLLGAVTKQLPRRTLFGYWHALFPSNDDGHAKDHLLYIGANDGNVRCRALALQLAAQLIYGSKPYLAQANCASARSNYTPFALSLASSVLNAYRQLTSILEREYAPPVLTNCLKCLAVLVQATPFEQLEMGFVYEFVPHVKKLARHVDTSIKVSALLVMEMLMTTPRFTQEIACAVGLPINERRLAKTTRLQVRQEQREDQQQFQQLCDSEEEEEPEELDVEVEQESAADKENLNHPNAHLPWPRIPRNSWLLRLVLRYLECPVSAAPLRVECLQVLLAMSSHFGLLREHLGRLAWVLCNALRDASRDVRLYAARCLDAVGYQMARHATELTAPKSELTPEQELKNPELLPETNAELHQRHLSFWQHMLPAIYAAYQEAGTAATLGSALCDALSNMGSYSFELLPQGQRNGLLAFLLGCSSDDSADRLVRAAALRALAVYVMHPTLRADLVFVEHAAELALRLSGDSQLAVRIKASWALGNISDALLASSQATTERNGEHEQQERISQALLSRLIKATVKSCSDHDKVRANAVRALGNLLRLLPTEEQALMQRAVAKLLDCVRAAGSAKVKWNACYAIGNLVRSRALFSSSASSAGTLFAALSQLIVQHANFKVRINATAVLLQVEQRADFGTHYANVWRSLLAAIERSHALDTFEEYNHRDALQQQLCLAMAHMLARARPDDLLTCRDALEGHLEVVSDTWRRVAYRILPEQAAPLFTCASLLKHRFEDKLLASEQRNALTFLAKALRLEG